MAFVRGVTKKVGLFTGISLIIPSTFSTTFYPTTRTNYKPISHINAFTGLYTLPELQSYPQCTKLICHMLYKDVGLY